MTTDDPNAERREQQLAHDRELRAKSMEEFNKRTQGVKPTPTQEENDRAALGEHVLDKEPDGSPEEDVSARPDVRGHQQQRRMEAKPASRQAGYETRAAETRSVPRSSTPSGGSSS